VIEFTDFQCPACAQHALEIQPVLDETFVDSGEIMWVFKNLPLGEHPHAPAAAVAAECAGEQNAFWEMHHRLFETQDEWSAEDNVDQIFLAEAEALGLDMTAFSTCFDSRLALERVLRDIYDSQGLVETTPNFVILYGGQGRVLRSSRPTDQFINLLSELLEEAEQAELENAQP
jgi:protein-disulfide isomerase